MRDAIVIVGAGFCGTVLTMNLLRRPGTNPRDITLVERGSAMHRGVAYAMREYPYLLNVPAGRLSADSSDPQQFLDYARTREAGVDAEDFLPRSLYGDYLEELLLRAQRESTPHANLERINDEVLELRRIGAGQIDVVFARRPALRANRVVLALGNPPPALPEWLKNLGSHAAVRANPWDLPQDLREHHSVLLVGNGLTMVDAALALSADPRRIPNLYTLSRRGLIPQTQTAFKHSAACGNGEELLAAASGDWREAITFVRNFAPQLWGRLPRAERARFVRHVQPHWDVHRHRLPPPLAQRLAHLRDCGKLRINAGRVHQVIPRGDRLQVSWRGRGRREETTLTVDAIVNATGPDYVLARSREPLLRSLRAQGLIAHDDLHLGIRTDPSGACLSAHGERTEDLYYLGPMLRADYWEATAVAELRGHAERLAQHLAAS
jgi:uncharacterized NAD(P)/FAD-binding protein YdhS